ncbi:MAG: sulfur relay protein DsrC [Chromatiales bacterium]|nr:MAG: sulfur relay protein DsrC [Chromatiales bacterium]
MEAIEVKLSDIIIQNPQVNSFDELLETVRAISSDDVLFLNFDVKPDYRDTPRNWQWRLEAAFS